MIDNVKRGRFQRQSYKKLLKQSIDVGVPFNDDVFKCEDKSVSVNTQYKSQLDVGKVVWKRPKEINDIPHFLYSEKLGPAAPIEFIGNGPNQWFIAACCAIAQDKNNVYKVVPKNQIHFLHGILKFNFWRFGKWIKVVIDDKLPTFDNKLVFSSSNQPVFWVALLEKAYAKLHGSYENMALRGNLSNALTDLTGSIVETVSVCAGASDIDKRDQFRFIAEELDKKTIICAQTFDDDKVTSSPLGLKRNRIYLVAGVKKPSSGTFRKTFSKDTTPMIHVVNTIYIATSKSTSSHRNMQDKLQEIWVPIDDFCELFETLTVCRLSNQNETKAFGRSNSQFCFDILQEKEEIVVDLMQKTSDAPSNLGFKIYKVEMNRNYRIHTFVGNIAFYVADSAKVRSVFKRISLQSGRYVFVPFCSNPDTDLLLRLQAVRVSGLRLLSKDMPRKGFLFFSPKYPKYVTKIIVKGAVDLEKQDRFGSANPYCVIRCNGKAVKSSVVHDTLSPSWEHFSAIFYHGEDSTIVVELWHGSLLLDTFIGLVEIVPKLTTNDLTVTQQYELCGRKKGHKRPGFIKFQIFTSEDLRTF